MSDRTPMRLKLFLPDARVLDREEIDSLPEERKRYAAASGNKGVWLELTCPDASCLDAEGRIRLPSGRPEKKGQGIFIDLFCPGDSCEVVKPTDLP